MSGLLHSVLRRNAARLHDAAETDDPLTRAALVACVLTDGDYLRELVVVELHAWEGERERKHRQNPPDGSGSSEARGDVQ